jgi:hypothetical protein
MIRQVRLRSIEATGWWRVIRPLSWPLVACSPLLLRDCLLPCAGVLSVCESARTQFAELAPVWQRIHAIIADENVEK